MSIATSPFSSSTKMLKPLQFFLIIALGGTSQSLPKNIPYWRQQTDVTETSFLSLFFKMLFYIIVFSILAIDGLRFFWFSQKIAHAHISGRQNKNKQKEKRAQSSDQLVNRVPTSIVSVDFEKNMPDSSAAFGCTNRRSTTSLQFYRIPSAKRYPEQRITKWVTAKNDRLRKWRTRKYVVLILQLISHHSFQKHEFFLQFLFSANKSLCES